MTVTQAPTPPQAQPCYRQDIDLSLQFRDKNIRNFNFHYTSEGESLIELIHQFSSFFLPAIKVIIEQWMKRNSALDFSIKFRTEIWHSIVSEWKCIPMGETRKSTFWSWFYFQKVNMSFFSEEITLNSKQFPCLAGIFGILSFSMSVLFLKRAQNKIGNWKPPIFMLRKPVLDHIKSVLFEAILLRVDIPAALFDDLNSATDNTWRLSNAKTIVQACVECLD